MFLNIRSLPKHIEEFRHDFIADNEIDVLCFAETRLCDATHELFNIQNYNMFVNNRNRRGGGVACYVHETFLRSRVNNLCLMEACIESLFVNVSLCNKSKRLIGCIYRPPNTDINVFIARLAFLCEDISKDYKNYKITITGDFNFDIFLNNKFVTEYPSLMYSYDFMPLILRQTRVTATSATLLDHIWINDILDVDYNVEYFRPLSSV